MTNKFNENLLGFVKKQLPESIVSKYEELYNLYANEQVQFRSAVHTLGMHLDNILEEMFENAHKIMKLKHTMMVENLSEEVISEELKQDIALLNLELIDAKKDIDQSKIMKNHAESGKFGPDGMKIFDY
jgi:hypothetical protein